MKTGPCLKHRIKLAILTPPTRALAAVVVGRRTQKIVGSDQIKQYVEAARKAGKAHEPDDRMFFSFFAVVSAHYGWLRTPRAAELQRLVVHSVAESGFCHAVEAHVCVAAVCYKVGVAALARSAQVVNLHRQHSRW
jgi:hypothetical protein